jgi:hypothetical protein
MQDFDRTIISQFSNSPIICQVLANLNQYLDPDADLEAFYDLIWHLDTAQGYGLDVWGRIVGINRVLTVAIGDYFGFNEANDEVGFDQAQFYNGQPLTANYTLTDEAYLRLILAKAARNITNDSIPAINQILLNLFPGRGNCYVTDGPNSPADEWFGFNEATDATGFDQQPFGDYAPALPPNMSLVYTFEFVLEPFEITIVTTSGVLPTPVGVKATASYLS